MGNAYSEDLRERVIRALKAGESQRATAKRYEVATGTLYNWWKVYREEGRTCALPDSGGKHRRVLFDEHIEAIISWVEEAPDMTNAEVVEKLKETFQVEVRPNHISRVLKAQGYTRKKNGR